MVTVSDRFSNVTQGSSNKRESARKNMGEGGWYYKLSVGNRGDPPSEHSLYRTVADHKFLTGEECLKMNENSSRLLRPIQTRLYKRSEHVGFDRKGRSERKHEDRLLLIDFLSDNSLIQTGLLKLLKLIKAHLVSIWSCTLCCLQFKMHNLNTNTICFLTVERQFYMMEDSQ